MGTTSTSNPFMGTTSTSNPFTRISENMTNTNDKNSDKVNKSTNKKILLLFIILLIIVLLRYIVYTNINNNEEFRLASNVRNNLPSTISLT